MSRDGQLDKAAEIPDAIVRSPEQVASGRLKTRLWWLTGLCAVLAAGLVVSSFRSQGSPIAIHFEDGHGLKAGDTLRYRGIDVGAVTSVKIADSLDGVEVEVLLAPGNEKVAVEGSQFWIERARLRLGQVSGLDTVLGAKYLGVIPGDPQNSRVNRFVGLEMPLGMTQGDSSEIRIRFPAGEGLAVGDTVRYRGISVGEVIFVELSESADSVLVGVRLVGASRRLAREGTQFWIERPRLDLTEIRGLETLVGGRYIGLETTSEAAPLQTEFVGLAEPPPLPRRDGSLEIELDAPNRLGLVRGAPITYRGLEVGRVSNVGLSNDGATVKVGAVIDAEYAELVRSNSKWWAIGGVKVDANLRGVHIAIDSLSAWIRGGIAFATPESPGERVVTGHRYVLEVEPQPEWLDWQPRIAVGHSQANGRNFPKAVRVVASWQASWLGLYRRRTAETWGLVVDGNRLFVPSTFVEEASEANTNVTIEIAGTGFEFNSREVEVFGPTAKLTLPTLAEVTAWSSENIGIAWNDKSILLVINPELSEPVALDGTRLAPLESGGVRIAPGVPLSATLNGSPVVNSATGNLLGLLVETNDGWVVGNLNLTPR